MQRNNLPWDYLSFEFSTVGGPLFFLWILLTPSCLLLAQHPVCALLPGLLSGRLKGSVQGKLVIP